MSVTSRPRRSFGSSLSPGVLVLMTALPVTQPIVDPMDSRMLHAACGNGVIESGEQCDDGAANGTLASCCSTDCQRTPDSDGDGTCDNVDPCTNPSGRRVLHPSLTIRRGVRPPGSERFILRGRVAIPRAPRLDLRQTGARVRVATASGAALVDARLPPGTPWRHHGATWRYGGTRSPIAMRVTAGRHLVRFTVSARRNLPSHTPLVATLVLDGATGSQNRCAELPFSIGDGTSCSSAPRSKRLECT